MHGDLLRRGARHMRASDLARLRHARARFTNNGSHGAKAVVVARRSFEGVDAVVREFGGRPIRDRRSRPGGGRIDGTRIDECDCERWRAALSIALLIGWSVGCGGAHPCRTGRSRAGDDLAVCAREVNGARGRRGCVMRRVRPRAANAADERVLEACEHDQRQQRDGGTAQDRSEGHHGRVGGVR